MKKIVILSFLLTAGLNNLSAQNKHWTLNDCMEFAVENSPKVKQKMYQTDNYQVDRTMALGSFLPYIGAGTSTTFSFGRSINPEDNTYKDVSVFRNPYYIDASLPIFNGGQLINQWKQSQVNLKLGKSEEQLMRDDVAINTMQAFMDVIYYQGMIRLATEKLEESRQSFNQTSRMEELGLKSVADVAQIEAQMAGDDYLLIQQQNLYNNSLLKLKELMNYPYDEPLLVDTTVIRADYLPEMESVEEIVEYAHHNNSQALAAEYQLKSYQLQHKIMKGRLLPTISLSTGISTDYFHELSSDNSPTAFKRQFKNNMGEYVTISLQFPVFDRFTRFGNVRKARNNVRIAAEQQTETLRQIQTTIEQNVQDRSGYVKEIIQMEKQVKANEIAYRLTLRKYEEGLMNSLDLQTSSYNLLQSRSNLLQCKLMYIIKDKIVDYYKGFPLIEE